MQVEKGGNTQLVQRHQPEERPEVVDHDLVLLLAGLTGLGSARSLSGAPADPEAPRKTKPTFIAK